MRELKHGFQRVACRLISGYIANSDVLAGLTLSESKLTTNITDEAIFTPKTAKKLAMQGDNDIK